MSYDDDYYDLKIREFDICLVNIIAIVNIY